MADSTGDLNNVGHGLNSHLPLSTQMVQVDEEIEALHPRMEDSIRALKSRRNLLVPICLLPTEVLAAVFMHCTSDFPAFVDGNLARGRATLFRIIRVCRHWRTIALNTPELWSRPDFSLGTPLASEMLGRSRDTPLVIEAEVGDGDTVGVLSEAFKHCISRIFLLHLTVTGDQSHLEQLLSALNQPTPSLRVLNLAFTPRGLGWSELRRLNLPDDFLANHAPRLTSLALRCFQIPLDSPLFNDITTLSLDMSGWSFTSAIELVECLKGMPRLEVIEIRNPFKYAGVTDVASDSDSTHKIVSFPHLNYFRMDAVPLSQAVRFLEHTTFAEAVTVSINAFEDSLAEFDALISSLSRVFFPCPNQSVAIIEPIRSIHISQLHSFSAWTLDTLPPVHPFFHPEHTSSSPPDLRAHISLAVGCDSRIGFPTFISGIVSAIGIPTHLRALHLDVTERTPTELSSASQMNPVEIEPSVKDFVALFGFLPNLDNVRLKGELAAILIAAFGRGKNGANPFPAIRTLELRGANQSEIRKKSLIRSIAGTLSEVIIFRRKHGLESIKKLILRRCVGLQADDVKLTREMIEEVDWDEWSEEEHELEFQISGDDFGDPPSPSPLYRPSIGI